MSTRSSARLREAARVKLEPQQDTSLQPSSPAPSGTSARKRTRASSSSTSDYYDAGAIIKQDIDLDERALRRLRLEADDIRSALKQQGGVNSQSDAGATTAGKGPQDQANSSNGGKRASNRQKATAIKTEATAESTTMASAGVKQPKNWRSVLDDLREFRKHNPAPVDTMGCERLAEVGEHIPPQVSRFQTLMSLVLSSQTKDTVTSVAIRRLQNELKGGLTIQSVLDVPSDELNKIIGAVGFHNKKTVFMKQIAEICRTQYGGDIPGTAEELIALPGVGPKMAYLTLQVAWQRNLGIGVDTHVHRISNRLGWVKTEKEGPEGTRKALQSWLPKEHWREINYIMVGFGQVLCLPLRPMCDICPVRDRCPTAPRSAKMKPIIKQEYPNSATTVVKDEPIEEAVVKVEEQDDESVPLLTPSTTTSTQTPPPVNEGEVAIHPRPSTRQSRSLPASPRNPVEQEEMEDVIQIKQESQDKPAVSKYF